ncbi:16S rRNA (adenine(1518)-N(6)/adenine(1519)-N(6))-dimethyltransferase RsmA [Mycoplasmopsis cynos]|uniref:16S rRNA (adenine(1518)-N(6)/adenine(1519)-N(6))- dimethyltransferase RsmA n=1 Tax=Mycoplasmopsis cynos TaxID=171284 RepID=UPI002AFE79C7|nr:16S rRNA (adenine(1518)-N(6)/adenine(1519)-N(6))-dimethyltransferase RsmA [Mycoplasmopsis cynos]WQQ18652.1 16S rRNA (adenine(1518)-N(6)/adenine(1519)-N(6))-dimethyltransferase RsmA [Mycoplasmopsis cynos]
MGREIFAKKKYGQNFLHDNNIIKKIVSLVEINDLNIIEIGPGRGALTKELLKKVKFLTAYEIDVDMVEILKKEISSEKFELINKDFLKVDLSEIKPSIIIANIPYYITSDILFKIFEYREKIKTAILMVQKEVAERIVALNNTSEYSKLSVSSQYLADVKVEFLVPSKCFVPKPKVDSAIISFKFKDNISNQEWKIYKDFFKLCFSNRRKKLSFALKMKYKMDVILKAYDRLKLDQNTRIQELNVSSIIDLYKTLEEKK